MDATFQHVPCKYCGDQPAMLGTKMCDGCWQLAARLQHTSKKVLVKILADLGINL